jgi:hypothetical protein
LVACILRRSSISIIVSMLFVFIFIFGRGEQLSHRK